MLGDTERAWELYAMLNPINHSSQPEASERYKVEPYVMCADIYGAPPHTGRGGWTWYTGAAGWMYRLSVETLLGLQLEADRLRLTPCIPADWQTYKVHYRYRETVYHINVRRVAEESEHVIRVILDNAMVEGTGVDSAGRPQGLIPLVDDHREHYVEVELS
jgi:cyclic beta-1,2-glucan synthetase